MSITIQQPQPYDLVDDTVHIAGVAGGAFEASFEYRIHEGHDEVTGAFMAGDGTGGHGQFHVAVDVGGASFVRERLFVEVFHTSPRDGAELDRVSVPVLHGPAIVPGYTVFDEYEIRRGDTLWAIAARAYGQGNLYHRLVAANPLTITDPNAIEVGQVIRLPR